MKKLKGTKDLSKRIQKHIKKITGIKVNIDCGTYFCWCHNSNTLYFIPWAEPDIDNLWIEWINKNFDCNLIPYHGYFISFLHELGHKMTLDNCSEYEKLKAEHLQEKEDENFKNLIPYWNCYREYIATEWAVNFILNHPHKFNMFMEEISKAVRHYYKINKIRY